MGLDFKEVVADVRAKAQDAILKAESTGLLGPDKLDWAAQFVADTVDRAIRLPGIIEPFDGPLVKVVARLIIQLVFNELRGAGKI